MSANVDRFSGEAEDPPVWGHCDYCGDSIGIGGMLYVHEGLNICDGCARRYAWALFEEAAARVCAAPDTPLVMRSSELRSTQQTQQQTAQQPTAQQPTARQTCDK